MIDYMTLLFAFITGTALGVFFFGGLWWTVLKGINTKNPGLIFSLSLIFRTGITVACFLFVSRGYFNRLAACLLGFFIARWFVMRFTRQRLEDKPRL